MTGLLLITSYVIIIHIIYNVTYVFDICYGFIFLHALVGLVSSCIGQVLCMQVSHRFFSVGLLLEIDTYGYLTAQNVNLKKWSLNNNRLIKLSAST